MDGIMSFIYWNFYVFLKLTLFASERLYSMAHEPPVSATAVSSHLWWERKVCPSCWNMKNGCHGAPVVRRPPVTTETACRSRKFSRAQKCDWYWSCCPHLPPRNEQMGYACSLGMPAVVTRSKGVLSFFQSVQEVVWITGRPSLATQYSGDWWDRSSINRGPPSHVDNRRSPFTIIGGSRDSTPSLQLLAKLLSDVVRSIQSTDFCQKNGMSSERTRRKF
jgi:hypothetical protein